MTTFLIAITGLLGAGSLLGIVALVARSSRAAKEKLLQVWTEGAPATATVLSATTNGSSNHHPRVLLSLEVTEPGKAPRRAQVTQVISRSEVERVEPGQQITVRVDRTDPHVVVVDEALTPGGY